MLFDVAEHLFNVLEMLSNLLLLEQHPPVLSEQSIDDPALSRYETPRQ